MAYVNVPKDLSKVKTKVAMNLTKRQLICFGLAALVGIPVYLVTRSVIGNSAAAILMIVLMLPFFFFAMFERDGLPAEMVLRNYIRSRILWPGTRPYRTENLYQTLTEQPNMPTGTKRRDNIATQKQTATKTSVGKRPAGKKQ